MRSRPMVPLDLLSRLLMAAILLVGMAIPPSTGMAANAVTANAVEGNGVRPIVRMDVHQHECCEPAATEPGCVASCSAVTCATPILPGPEAALFISRDAAVPPLAARVPRSRGPEPATPPPRA
jgi:hypothetical protein